MANTTVNKVVLGNETLLDLTADTVTPQTLYLGTTAHDASGASIVGTLDSSSGSVYQDADGYLVVDDSESSAPQGNISITSNGTYDVADYAGASVNVEDAQLKKLIERSNSLLSFNFPSGIETIGSYAFNMMANVDFEKLPDTVRYIRDGAFRRCYKLSLRSLPAGLQQIGSDAFSQCSALALSELPPGITAIQSNVFYQCENITISSLPNGVTYIGSDAFTCCKSIESMSCEGAIFNLGTSSFLGSSSYPMALAHISFPNMTISNIGSVFGSSTAAQSCQLLEDADIGSAAGIGSNAFANCYALQTLVLRKSDAICTLANVSAFTNTPMSGYNSLTGTVYVPQALISTYQTATNWSTLYNGGTVTFAAIEGSEYELD